MPDKFLRPLRGYRDINLQEFTMSSNYNSLQVSASQRLTSGLQFRTGMFNAWNHTYT